MAAVQTAFTVRVQGMRDVSQALGKMDVELRTRLGDDLKQAAEPVATEAKAKVARYRGVSIGTIRARRYAAQSVWVEQGARKVTGARGDFGALQMREALIPALEEKSDVVVAGIEAALYKYAASAGF